MIDDRSLLRHPQRTLRAHRVPQLTDLHPLRQPRQIRRDDPRTRPNLIPLRMKMVLDTRNPPQPQIIRSLRDETAAPPRTPETAPHSAPTAATAPAHPHPSARNNGYNCKITFTISPTIQKSAAHQCGTQPRPHTLTRRRYPHLNDPDKPNHSPPPHQPLQPFADVVEGTCRWLRACRVGGRFCRLR